MRAAFYGVLCAVGLACFAGCTPTPDDGDDPFVTTQEVDGANPGEPAVESKDGVVAPGETTPNAETTAQPPTLISAMAELRRRELATAEPDGAIARR